MGATGKQGGAAVKAFHDLAKQSDNKLDFQLRAITRDPTKDTAKEIEPLVHEVVKADGNDVASMVEAFKGCYGAFLVTDFWQDMNVDNEMQVLRNLKEAVKEAGVKHVVLSSLEGSKEYVNSLSSEEKETWKPVPGAASSPEAKEMYVPHLDGKFKITKEFQDSGVPVTMLYTSFYYENFIYFGMGPSRQSDSDPYAITLPMADAKLQMVAVADIGKAVCAIFQDSSLIGKTVGVRSASMTGQEIVDVFTSMCGVPVSYNKVPWDVYASFGFPGAEEMGNMFRLFVEEEQTYITNRDTSDELLKGMGGAITLEDWIASNKHAFELQAEDPATKETYTPPPSNDCCSQCTIS